jgi:hypothetical protein
MSTVSEDDMLKDAIAAARAPKIWRYRTFNTPQEACTWLNRSPAQGVGEVSTSVRENGHTTDVFYFL